MLRAVHHLILFLTTFVQIHFAHAILFQATDADSEEFQRYAVERNQQTYAQLRLREAVESPSEAHSQVLEFSKRVLSEKSSKQRSIEWDRLRASIELNRTDREILTLLAEKLGLNQELCRYLVLEPELVSLLENPQSAKVCEYHAVSIPKNLLTQLSANDVLIIDGKAFTKNQIPVRLIAGLYQWRIISDRYLDRDFSGSAQAFASKKFSTENWVQGNCDKYSFEKKDFSFLIQTQIYFNANCIKPGIPKEKTFSEWAQDHKALLWGLGILAAGVAASQLKDKTLEVTKP